MTWLGLTPATGNASPTRPAVMAVADHLDATRAALSAGADIIDFGDIDLSDPARADIAAFLAAQPGLAFRAYSAAGAPAVTRRPTTALVGQTVQTVLICADLAAARACGYPADSVAVLTQPRGIAAVRLAGYPAIVDADQVGSADPDSAEGLGSADAGQTGIWPVTDEPERVHPASVAGSVAAAALSAWLGASLVRTRHPLQVRRGIDMVAVIAGIGPPARAVRGLA